MVAPKGEIWFLASCVEDFKVEKGLSGREAYDFLRKTKAVEFIISRWEGLHMTSPQYIVDSIDEFIESRRYTDSSSSIELESFKETM